MKNRYDRPRSSARRTNPISLAFLREKFTQVSCEAALRREGLVMTPGITVNNLQPNALKKIQSAVRAEHYRESDKLVLNLCRTGRLHKCAVFRAMHASTWQDAYLEHPFTIIATEDILENEPIGVVCGPLSEAGDEDGWEGYVPRQEEASPQKKVINMSANVYYQMDMHKNDLPASYRGRDLCITCEGNFSGRRALNKALTLTQFHNRM